MMSSPAWSWLRPGSVPVPESPGTKQQKVKNRLYRVNGPVLYQFITFALSKETQRVGNQGSWITQGLGGENVGPRSLLKYNFCG